MKERKKAPVWFHLIVWGGMALFVIFLAWLGGLGGEQAIKVFDE